jgi:hypothetical protein
MRAIARVLVLMCPLFPVNAQITHFSHVVVIVQENRTPDNLFQGLCEPPYGAANTCSTTPSASQYNIQTATWMDKTSSSGITQPGQVALANKYDLNHAHSAFTAMCDADAKTGACKMDGAAGVTCSGTCPAKPQFRFVIRQLHVPDQPGAQFSGASILVWRNLGAKRGR